MSGRARDEAIELMYWGVRVFTAGPDAVLATRGLGRVHHRVLYCIARSPGIRVGELADLLGVSRQALHRTLRELESRGLVARTKAEASARERALSLTPPAIELERRLATDQRRLLEGAERALGAEAMDGWRAVMRFIARPGIEAVPEGVAHHLAHLLKPAPGPKRARRAGTKAKRPPSGPTRPSR